MFKPVAYEAQEEAEMAIARYAEIVGEAEAFEWLNALAGQYLFLAVHVGDLEIEGLEDNEDAVAIAELAAAEPEGNA
jgi:hypothetical protein